MSIQEVADNGVVGAGGAGFPTSVKLESAPDTVIMNAAECEPLLHKDMEMILNYPDEIIAGLNKVMKLTGAKQGIIGIKDKHPHEIKLLESKISGRIKIIKVEDVYPAGDEQVLIQMTVGRIVQPGARPDSVGCLVQNVETLYNIGIGKPVVDKFLSIAGAVENPATIKVPVGTTYADVLSKFSFTTDDYVIRVGGLMMGQLQEDLNSVINKKTGALIVLPRDHHCVRTYNRFKTPHDTDRIAKAACDQCNFCTELCPRYLIGQPVRPETAMRNRMFTREDQPMVHPGNMSCCECNLCTMYSCPEGLDPAGATIIEKRLSMSQNLQWNGKEATPHPLNEYRRVPTKKLMARLDVLMFKDEGPLRDIGMIPKEVRIPLDGHIGATAQPAVKVGQAVKKYDLVATADGKISSNCHASIDGIIDRITDKEIVIKESR